MMLRWWWWWWWLRDLKFSDMRSYDFGFPFLKG
jgi:hypothetical protein